MTATAADTREIIDELKKRHVRFLLLQFTDLLGVNKAVEVPSSQFERALAGEVTFDGSALEGFARVEEADALLVPDLPRDRKSTRLNSSHGYISYAVFCLKKKKNKKETGERHCSNISST